LIYFVRYYSNSNVLAAIFAILFKKHMQKLP